MTPDAILLVTEVCSAILAVAAVLAVLARVFIQPRIAEVDASLARIEGHLERLNGSVTRMSDWEHQHELSHARREGV